jgi:hypothetical protein
MAKIWPHSIDKLFGRRAGYPLGESPCKLDVHYYSGSRWLRRRGNELRHRISGKTWRTASRSIRLDLPERLRKASCTGTTFWQFAGFLTDLAHGAP